MKYPDLPVDRQGTEDPVRVAEDGLDIFGAGAFDGSFNVAASMVAAEDEATIDFKDGGAEEGTAEEDFGARGDRFERWEVLVGNLRGGGEKLAVGVEAARVEGLFWRAGLDTGADVGGGELAHLGNREEDGREKSVDNIEVA